MPEEVTPVLFRKAKGEVTAVFPTVYEGRTREGVPTMSCYAHFGQHSACTFGWYVRTKEAKPADYADLKHELESAPYAYRLKVYRRLTKQLRAEFDKEVNRIDRRSA